MKRNLRSIIVAVAIVSIVGIGTVAFADWGMGPGMRGRWHGNESYDDYGAKGSDYGNRLSDAQIEKLEQERRAFIEATDNLRNDIYVKELELRSEMAKNTPNAQKVLGLQKELSNLRSEFAQKKIAHMLNMKEINPDMGRGFYGRGYAGRGRHMGYGRGSGSGSDSGEYCRR